MSDAQGHVPLYAEDLDDLTLAIIKYRPDVMRVCYRVLHTLPQPFQAAEDVTQEVLVKAWRKRSNFRVDADLKTWLISIARNASIDYYRQNKKRAVKTNSLDVIAVASESGVGIRFRDLLSSESLFEKSADESIVLREEIRCLREALMLLPPFMRTVVVLRDLEELSYREITAKLGIPEGTVKSRVNRGRIELARHVRRLRAQRFS